VNTPPLLIAAVLLFWGWQTRLLSAALPMALVLEALRLLPWRLHLRERDFSWIWKLCGALFLAAFILAYFTGGEQILRAIQWAPVIFLPIAAAQAASTRRWIDSRVFFLWITARPVNLGYPYVMLTLFAACAAMGRSPWFFAGLAAAAGWTLWSVRPARSSRLRWTVLFTAASMAGFIGAGGLRALQTWVEDLYVGSYGQALDTANIKTAIGDIGRRKQSGAIILRVRDAGGAREALHLTQAGYNVYRDSAWYAVASPLAPAPSTASGWRIGPGEPAGPAVEISMPLKAGEGLLAAVSDAVLLDGLKVRTLAASRMGAVKAEGGPGLATYRLLRSGAPSLQGLPDERDLSIPASEEQTLSAVAEELALPAMDGPAVLAALRHFFESRFVYTLDLEGGGGHATPLADFLLRTRAGHCEYFATAAVLLLRKAGIPARYVAGYLAHEFSPLEEAFVVRSRDAHAWVLAYVDGEWRTFDPTPPAWIAVDEKAAGVLLPMGDLWSYLSTRFSRWRWSESRLGIAVFARYGLLVLLPPILYLGWRVGRRFRFHRPAAVPERIVVLRPGHDSPFFRIERLLAGPETARIPGETHGAWLNRIHGRRGLDTRKLLPALSIHNRYRFDPRGIAAEELKELATAVAAFCHQMRQRGVE
jgi:protein-glutamine gamma-glutamyltransferase